VILQILQVIWPFSQEHWDFLKENWEFLTGLVTSLGGLGTLFWRYRKHRRKQLLAGSDVFPFEVIQPHTNGVIQQLFRESSVEQSFPNPALADFNIPYQPRRADRNVRRELEQALEETGWLLILGPAGLGKTREAAELAWTLNNEGWTILKYKEGQWLDVPSDNQFPESCSRRKLLFFLDNLNRITYRGRNSERPPGSDDPSQPLKVPFQKRLLRVLKFFEGQCDPEQIRVIAIARNELYREADKPSYLEKLELDKFSDLWKRFQQYVLPEPDDQAIVQLLAEVVPKAGIQSNPEDYLQIAQRNDNTFNNIVENLRSAWSRDRSLTLDEFRDILTRTWNGRYRRAVKRYPVARYIYGAVELLQAVDVALDRTIVAATARMLTSRNASGNVFKHLWYTWKIHVALNDLAVTERILEPRDGQIEAKGNHINVQQYILPLSRLLIRLTDRHPERLLNSLSNFANALDDLGFREEAIVSYTKIVELKPDAHEAWNNLGRVQIGLGRYQEAIASYDQAIKHKPEKHQAWDGRGIACSKLKNYQEAIDSYDQALSYKRDDSQSLYNRGNALYYLKRYQEAITDWKRAGEKNPDLHQAFYNQACGYAILGEVEQALENLEKAVHLEPERYRESAKKESDFSNIQSNQRFQRLVYQ
jgi:tetratricopeptide (TPR) repeat protein